MSATKRCPEFKCGGSECPCANCGQPWSACEASRAVGRKLPPCDHDECPPTKCGCELADSHGVHHIGCMALTDRQRAADAGPVPRRIVAFNGFSVGEDWLTMALAHDGTLWAFDHSINNASWFQVPPLPPITATKGGDNGN